VKNDVYRLRRNINYERSRPTKSRHNVLNRQRDTHCQGEIKKMEERTLKKVNANKYELVLKDKTNKSEQTIIYNKEQMKENHGMVLQGYHSLVNAVADTKRGMKNVTDVKDTKEIRKFQEMLVKASKLTEKDKLDEQLVYQQEQLSSVIKQRSELEHAMPELKRNK